MDEEEKKFKQYTEIVRLAMAEVYKHDKPSTDTMRLFTEQDKRMSLQFQKIDLALEKIDKFINESEKSFAKKWVEKGLIWFLTLFCGSGVVAMSVFIFKGMAENL